MLQTIVYYFVHVVAVLSKELVVATDNCTECISLQLLTVMLVSLV